MNSFLLPRSPRACVCWKSGIMSSHCHVKSSRWLPSSLRRGADKQCRAPRACVSQGPHRSRTSFPAGFWWFGAAPPGQRGRRCAPLHRDRGDTCWASRQHRDVCQKPCRRPNPPTYQRAEGTFGRSERVAMPRKPWLQTPFSAKNTAHPPAGTPRPAADPRRPFAALCGPRSTADPAQPGAPRPAPPPARHWARKFLAGGGLAEGRSGPRGPPMKGGGRCGAGQAGCGLCAGWS